MEIRLNCNKIIELNNFDKLKLIKINIYSYKLEEDNLNGDVKVEGDYYKKDCLESMGFEELIPFTIVFNNKNVKIENIFIENDSYTINSNVGVEVSFDIIVKYSLIENKNVNDSVIEVPVEIEEVVQVSNKMLEEVEDITAKYESLLDELFDVRQDSNNNENQFIKKQKDSYKTISIFYINNEKELDIISRERRIPLQDLYKQNEDYSATHRIIIND